ncbi:hypothetical protein C8Q74DRAFT_1247925 [Fomes fomentarius]|nr:hypothetical protein C8Q74DRAFT_1247925 [Fomes fomentarius]
MQRRPKSFMRSYAMGRFVTFSAIPLILAVLSLSVRDQHGSRSYASIKIRRVIPCPLSSSTRWRPHMSLPSIANSSPESSTEYTRLSLQNATSPTGRS